MTYVPRIVEHGIDRSGPTAAKPTKAAIGQFWLDETTGVLYVQTLTGLSAVAVAPSRVYYVDGVAGSDSTGDGKSWATAYKTITKAAAIGTAWQALQANVDSRYTILVAATPYPYAKDAPVAMNYCDVIGTGATPRGNGTGITRIRGITSTQVAALIAGTYTELDAAAVCGGHAFTAPSGGMRGVNFYNIQFECDCGYDAFHASGVLLRSTFEDCAFNESDNTTSVTAGNAGIYTASSVAGLTVRRCHFGSNGPPCLLYGMYCLGSPAMNNCLFEDNTVNASAGGLYVQNTPLDTNTCYRRNTIWSGNSAEGAVGIKCGPHAFITENMIAAADAINGASARNMINNHIYQGSTAAIETAST